jgi:hypothetical protein
MTEAYVPRQRQWTSTGMHDVKFNKNILFNQRSVSNICYKSKDTCNLTPSFTHQPTQTRTYQQPAAKRPGGVSWQQHPSWALGCSPRGYQHLTEATSQLNITRTDTSTRSTQTALAARRPLAPREMTSARISSLIGRHELPAISPQLKNSRPVCQNHYQAHRSKCWGV